MMYTRCPAGGWKRAASGAALYCECFPYQQARFCSDNTLANVWMSAGDVIGFPGAFTTNNGAVCYYFAGDGGSSPGTLYTAGQAQGTTDCASCPGCWNGMCDGTTSYQLTSVGNWNIAASCGQPSSTTAPPDTFPLTLVANGPCTYVVFSLNNLPTTDALPPGDMSILGGGFQLEVFDDGTGTILCPHFRWRIFAEIALAAGGSVNAYWWGPRTPNGAGNYYLSLASDPYPSDACVVGNIPPVLVIA